MDALVLVIEIVLCLFSLFMIAVVLLQSGKSAGLPGEIAGGAETFLGKGKAKSYENRLKKMTKIAAVGIMVLAIALVLIQVYLMPNGDNTSVPEATPSVEATSTSAPTPEPLTRPDPTTTPEVSADTEE
jgi:preprotein translocase subunit SecG